MRILVRTAGPIIGKLLLTIVLAVILIMILSIAAAAFTMALNKQFILAPDLMLKDPFFVKVASWAQALGFIGAVWIMYLWFERRGKASTTISLGIERVSFIKGVLKGILAGAILITLSCAFIWLFDGVEVSGISWNDQVFKQLLSGLALFIMVSLNEELFIRGYLFGLLRAKYSAYITIGCTAVLFAMMHSFNPGIWSSPVPMLNLLVVGILFGAAREWFGSLWVPVGMHFSWNFLQGNVYGLHVSGTAVQSVFLVEASGKNYISGGSFGAEGSLLTTLVLLLGIILLYNLNRSKKLVAIGRDNHESL